MNRSDREGVEAYVYLESLVGRTCSHEFAADQWAQMQPKDRELTKKMAAHYRAVERRARARQQHRSGGSGGGGQIILN